LSKRILVFVYFIAAGNKSVRDFAVNNSNAISYKHLQFMFLKCVRPVMTLNGLAMYRVTQKNGHHQKSNNFQNFI